MSRPAPQPQPVMLQQPCGHWLRGLRDNWPAAVRRALVEERADAVIRVVVAEVQGSAPREPGACMLVTPNSVHGTIGGGNLEWAAVRCAHALLHSDAAVPSVHIQRSVLAKELAQCCGGVVKLWLER